MKVTGIIAEYNPFHLGHQYHLDQAREKTGADYIAVVMSGDFMQRGKPAVFDKYTRARMALMCGADVVLEMPSVFACGSAEDFASCGVALLNRLGIVDCLFFGSEAGEIEPLWQAAALLSQETEEFSSSLKKFLCQGLSYPSAREKALASCLSSESLPLPLEEKPFFSLPNNILGMEYCRAILRQNSSVKPVTIPRLGSYHSSSLSDRIDDRNSSVSYSSASAIRAFLYKNESPSGDSLPSGLLQHIPDCLYSSYQECHPIFSDDFSSLLNYAVLSAFASGRSCQNFEGFSPELCARLKRFLYSGSSWEGRVQELKTKNYTYTRISRALLHLMLGITTDLSQSLRDRGYAPYARILGFRKSASPLLSQIKRHSAIPLITKTADGIQAIDCRDTVFLKKDFYASHIYQAVLSGKYGIPAQNEYTRPLAILP